MSQVKARPKWSDWRLFFAKDTGLVFAGMVSLALVEGNWFPPESDLHAFVNTWKIALIIASVALIVLPSVWSKGIDRLRARAHAVVKRGEISQVMGSIQARIANLTVKHEEALGGKQTNTYIGHTIHECRSYFSSRRTLDGEALGHREPTIDVAYFRRGADTENVPFNRIKQTSEDSSLFNGVISRKGGRAAKKIIEDALDGRPRHYQNEPQGWASALLGETRADAYASAVVVPVMRGRDAEAPDGVRGMLVVVSSDSEALVASDKEIVGTYAWCVAAAESMDEAVQQSSPGGVGSLPAGEAGVG